MWQDVEYDSIFLTAPFLDPFHILKIFANPYFLLLRPKVKTMTTAEANFVLPSPCQGSGASPFYKLPEAPTAVCHSASTHHKYGNVFNWRPDLENVLLDALELSIDDMLSRQ